MIRQGLNTGGSGCYHQSPFKLLYLYLCWVYVDGPPDKDWLCAVSCPVPML